ncbi:UNKNOWN [Stylonychia lemnae]|uniref:Uncharacterized protein n=1 Tax=Stylonychia lemnae TaxID=5949 RepID=A0A078AQ74_STYLE|nr:UNKNOWN [Stylonychia lemnae]|eukprot:CDW84545.1 UNKNOWN [Stylonychia lemnae]
MNYQNTFNPFPQQTNSINSCFSFGEPKNDQLDIAEVYMNFDGDSKQHISNDGFLPHFQSFYHQNTYWQTKINLDPVQTQSNGDQFISKCDDFNNCNIYDSSSEADMSFYKAETRVGTKIFAHISDPFLNKYSCPIQQQEVNQNSQESNFHTLEFQMSSQEEYQVPNIDQSTDPSDNRELIQQAFAMFDSLDLNQNLLLQTARSSNTQAAQKKSKSINKDKMQRQNSNDHTQVQQKTKPTKLKLDQGFKFLLRDFRKALFIAFEKSGLSKGYHHFGQRWLAESKAFLQGWGLIQPTDRQICALSVLLYHTLGTTIKTIEKKDSIEKNGKKQKETIFIKKDNIFNQVLGEEGMQIYKLVFDQNRTETVDQFLQDDFIRTLWPLFIQYSEQKFFFIEKSEDEKPAQKTKVIKKGLKNGKVRKSRSQVLNELKPTLQHISWLLIHDYKLAVPAHWLEKFPPAYMKKKESKKAKIQLSARFYVQDSSQTYL